MPRRLRFTQPGSVVEITQRTVQGRFLLRPSPQLNRVALGVLGRAQRKYSMPIHSFGLLSNHYHLSVEPESTRHQALFAGYFSGNLAREIGRLHDWSGKVWSRRYAAVPVTDEPEAQIARLKYLLAQGVKEGLVEKVEDWPGATGVPQLLDPTYELAGTWYDRTVAYRAGLAGSELRPEDWIFPERVVLSPLPALAHLSAEERVAFIRRLITEIEEEAAASRSRPVVGISTILTQNPAQSTASPRRSPIPLVHAATVQAWKAFKAAYRSFLAAYTFASAQLRAGVRDVVFPAGCFPPALPCVSCAPT